MIVKVEYLNKPFIALEVDAEIRPVVCNTPGALLAERGCVRPAGCVYASVLAKGIMHA